MNSIVHTTHEGRQKRSLIPRGTAKSGASGDRCRRREDDVHGVGVEEGVLVSEILNLKYTSSPAPAASFGAWHAVISDRLCRAREELQKKLRREIRGLIHRGPRGPG